MKVRDESQRAGSPAIAIFSFRALPPNPLAVEWFVNSAVYEITTHINPVPEPSTWLLVPTAVGLAWLARKRGQGRRLPHCLYGYGS